MANLIVRNIRDDLVQSLKERAAKNGRSADAEHRIILAEALKRPRKKSFAEVLSTMPDVGLDEDFERVQAEERPDDVFT